LTGKTTQRHIGGSSTKPEKPFAARNGKLMTAEEAADYLGVKKRMVDRLVDRNELRATKIGKLVRIHVDDLEAYIATMRGEAV
jgi:excisionase family DNA binding protein